jgi:hypothetical protein
MQLSFSYDEEIELQVVVVGVHNLGVIQTYMFIKKKVKKWNKKIMQTFA